jgi:hypothetical protein
MTREISSPAPACGRRPTFLRHRVNRIADLDGLDPSWGAEIDLRSDPCRPGAIHLSHDPWTSGDDFAAWAVRAVARGLAGPVLLNTKEDGLEARALEIAAAAGLRDVCFLDTALPTLVQWTLVCGDPRFAVRLSVHEPLAALAPFRGRAAWAWVDCFDAQPLSAAVVAAARADFRVCLVSPELQGGGVGDLDRFAALWPLADAVCTKDPAAWVARFGAGVAP